MVMFLDNNPKKKMLLKLRVIKKTLDICERKEDIGYYCDLTLHFEKHFHIASPFVIVCCIVLLIAFFTTNSIQKERN